MAQGPVGSCKVSRQRRHAYPANSGRWASLFCFLLINACSIQGPDLLVQVVGPEQAEASSGGGGDRFEGGGGTGGGDLPSDGGGTPTGVGGSVGRGGSLSGLSQDFPLDKGIEEHPDVVFVERFEDPNWVEQWQENARSECKKLEADPKVVHNGGHSLRLKFELSGTCGGKGGAGWMHHWPDNGKTGYDVAYVRYYYRVSKGGVWSNNKVLQMHGHKLGLKYGDGAGVAPDGTTFSVGTGIGGSDGPPWSVGVLYTYHKNQPGKYGEVFEPNQGAEPPVLEETWYCKEFMVKLNDVGSKNGEQRMWLDDQLVVETTGLEFRTHPEVKMNNLMQPSYTSVPGDREMWLDSIVMATSRIGCMRH